MRSSFLLSSLFLVVLLGACKTKNDLRREQEVDRLRNEMNTVRGDRADIDTLSEELKVEITRMSNLVEERAVVQRQQVDELKKDIAQLNSRLQAMEQKVESAESAERAERAAERQRQVEKPRPSFELGKKQFDEGHYQEAIETLRPIAHGKKSEEAKKSQFLLAEAHFANKEFASAALEFSEFKKAYPKDAQLPVAIYRQANSFRNMNKTKEAKLFYQELIDRYPKNALAAKAKQEMRRLK